MGEGRWGHTGRGFDFLITVNLPGLAVFLVACINGGLGFLPVMVVCSQPSACLLLLACFQGPVAVVWLCCTPGSSALWCGHGGCWRLWPYSCTAALCCAAQDMHALGCLPPTLEPRATDHIQVSLISSKSCWAMIPCSTIHKKSSEAYRTQTR